MRARQDRDSSSPTHLAALAPDLLSTRAAAADGVREVLMSDRDRGASRPLVRSALAALACLWAACEGPAVFPLGADPDGAVAQLESETGHRWYLRRHPLLGTPAYLDGRTAPMAVTPRDAERAARLFLSQHRGLFALADTEAELATIDSDTDELGSTRTRFVQRIGRVPVWGSHLGVHFDSAGALVRVTGHYGPLASPSSLEPTLSADEARVGAAVLARAARPAADPDTISTSVADLYIFPLEDGAATTMPRPSRLAWHVIATVAEAQPPLRLETLFDATDGALLLAADRIETVAGSGVGVFGDRKPLIVAEKKTAYWLEDATRGQTPLRTFSAHSRLRLPGAELRSADAERWDVDASDGIPGAAVDAHAHVARAWDYFAHAHGRPGWDGAGSGLRAVVHYGDRFANAFFDGTQLVFGDGDDNMTAPAAALDVVAHEFTHGVVAATAGLENQDEPGAINEGIADLFGCLVAWTSGQGGRWQIGETIYHPKGARNRPMRDLANPHMTGQPASVDEIEPTGKDQGGVHTNASIAGHLGYLLVEGAAASGKLPAVVALGPDVTGKLFYRALSRYLFERSGFADLADALCAAARDLGGGLELPVTDALRRVGLR
jgi:thermolysin